MFSRRLAPPPEKEIEQEKLEVGWQIELRKCIKKLLDLQIVRPFKQITI